jgi:hypothetical protein
MSKHRSGDRRIIGLSSVETNMLIGECTIKLYEIF